MSKKKVDQKKLKTVLMSNDFFVYREKILAETGKNPVFIKPDGRGCRTGMVTHNNDYNNRRCGLGRGRG